MTEQEQAKKNERNAFFYSIGVQAAIFLLLFVMVAYSPPDPPNPQIGVELNLGFDNQGGGDNPATTPVGNEGNQPEEAQSKPEEVQPEEVKETVTEEAKPVDTKPAEDVVSTKTESPVPVKKKEETKPIEKPKEKAEEKKPEVKPQTPQAVYKPAEKKTDSDTKATGAKEGKAGSEGDDSGKTGNKGEPEGTLVKGGQYNGTPGGGNKGVSMSGFNGFDWPKIEPPPIPGDANGVYEFKVFVDSDGTVTRVETVQRGLSFEAEKKFKDLIRKLEFTPKGADLPENSEGNITFRVTSQ